jgi:hypothetical protein
MPGYVLAAASRIAVHVMASAARSLAASCLKMFMSESGSTTVPSALKWPVVSGGMGRSTSPSAAKTAGMSGILRCGLLVAVDVAAVQSREAQSTRGVGLLLVVVTVMLRVTDPRTPTQMGAGRAAKPGLDAAWPRGQSMQTSKLHAKLKALP